MKVFTIPTVNVVGRGSVKEIGSMAARFGSKTALVVASTGDVGLAQAKLVADVLKGSGIDAELFCKVTPNPLEETVMEGLALYGERGCGFLVAVGGGSAMDAAKGIGILATNGGRIEDYAGVDKVRTPIPPLVAVATTAGTGSEVTQFAVISDANHNKMTLNDRDMLPTISVNDPEMMLSMPPALTAATGMDALTHAIEAYVSTGASPLTDGRAWAATNLIAQNLPRAVQDGTNVEVRERMCYGSFLAGIAFNNAGLGLVHAMAHPLGGHYNLPHGLCNALLLPAVCRFNLTFDTVPRFAALARAFGVAHDWRPDRENAEACLRAIDDVKREAGLKESLRAHGVKREDFPLLADRALLETVGATNPRPFDRADVIALYEEAF